MSAVPAFLRGAIGKAFVKLGEVVAGAAAPEHLPLSSVERAAREVMDAWSRTKQAFLSPVKYIGELAALVKNQGTPIFVDKTGEGLGLVRVTAVETRWEGGERVVAAGSRGGTTVTSLVFNIRVIRPIGREERREEEYTVVVPGDARLYHLLPLAAVYALNRDRLAKMRSEHPKLATLLDLYVAPLADALLRHYDNDTLRRLANEAMKGPISEERALRLLGGLRTATGTWKLRVYERDGKPSALLIESKGITGRRSGWFWLAEGTPYAEAASILWDEERGGIEVKPFNPEFLTVAEEYRRHYEQLADTLERMVVQAERRVTEEAVKPQPVLHKEKTAQPLLAPAPLPQQAGGASTVQTPPAQQPVAPPAQAVETQAVTRPAEKKEEKPERLIIVPERVKAAKEEKGQPAEKKEEKPEATSQPATKKEKEKGKETRARKKEEESGEEKKKGGGKRSR